MLVDKISSLPLVPVITVVITASVVGVVVFARPDADSITRQVATNAQATSESNDIVADSQIEQEGFVGPQGPEGPAGPQGPVGLRGLTGADGSRGPVGPEGKRGLTGQFGPVGAEGSAGPQGAAGAEGSVGPQGAAGAEGSAGPQGAAGAEGPVGPQGAAGAEGSQDLVGPEGPQGPVGPPGPVLVGGQGPLGPQGPAGADGADGADGLNCWDLNGNGIGDPHEDINGDGQFDVLDCLGQDGPPGADSLSETAVIAIVWEILGELCTFTGDDLFDIYAPGEHPHPIPDEAILLCAILELPE